MDGDFMVAPCVAPAMIAKPKQSSIMAQKIALTH